MSLLSNSGVHSNIDFDDFSVDDAFFSAALDADMFDSSSSEQNPVARKLYTMRDVPRHPRTHINSVAFDTYLADFVEDETEGDDNTTTLTNSLDVKLSLRKLTSEFGDFLLDFMRVGVTRQFYFDFKCVELICSVRAVLSVSYLLELVVKVY